MSLAPGTRVGPYVVESLLGRGGMGEVYRAADSRLGRSVALKTLPDLFAGDPERLMRFEREAKTLASLNHPHIAHIHGIEESGGVRALVMELVDGEDLAQRLARGALPMDESLPIARQVAEALEAAHEAGIIHRDLKPANIKVRPDGAVKVLDFGLAKAIEQGAGGDMESAANSPTFTSPAFVGQSQPPGTRMGVLLGTAAYMAPEQARGRAVDKRADIWAFGCLFYEMLTGRPAFRGETITDTLAAVMTRELNFDALPPGTPPPVRRLIARCLERDARLRLRDIGEARIALGDASVETPVPPAAAPAPSAARTAGWLAASVLAAAATGAVVWQMRAPSDAPARRFTIPMPDDAPPQVAAISPAGHAVAFISGERVWLQRLDEFSPVEVPASDGANAVFWSPDSTALGFQARGQLWKVAAAGGTPVPIGTVPQEFTAAGGAAWLEDGRIVFATGGSGLLQLPADGGTVTSLLDLDPTTEADFHNVSALPGGRGVLFVRHPAVAGEDFSIEVFGLSDNTRRIILQRPNNPVWPVYSRTGHVLVEEAGGVWMIPFSLERLEATGAPSLMMADARAPSIARDGTLVLLPGNRGGGDARLTLIDRSGRRSTVVGTASGQVANPRISPNGRLVAATVGNGADADIWIFDVERGTDRRLTFEAGADGLPSWTPDSQHVVYHCGTSVCARRADGTGGRVILIDNTLPTSPPLVSPDGRRLVFVRETKPADGDLWSVDLRPGAPLARVTATPRPLITSERMQRHPDISRDGRFIAYVSAETGPFAVYVSRFPEGDGKWEVSRGFGTFPRWGPSRGHLYFFDGLSRIAEMPVDLTSTFQPGAIAARIPTGGAYSLGFDVTANGQQFLLPLSPSSQRHASSLLVVQNWW